jgi:N-acetyl sugar amidotransferase
MDESDPEIVFTETGCNHCDNYFQVAKWILRPYSELEQLAEKIKNDQKGNKYDCVLGISGGMDSSYTAYLVHKLGLRVLLTHFDNDWNTPQSIENVEIIANKTGWDIEYETCDLEEYRDIQLAYLKAGVINLEAISDHAIAAKIFNMAKENKIKYILSGSNWATEGILPRSGGYRNDDLSNLKNIHRKYGTIPLKTLPMMSFLKKHYLMKIYGLQMVRPLNYVDYDREKSKLVMMDGWGWKDYGVKHGESYLTKFYQQYILPVRWGIDKRKAHLSTMICSEQLTREEGLKILERAPYDPQEFTFEHQIFLEKMQISDAEFEGYMNAPKRKHEDFKTACIKQGEAHSDFFSHVLPMFI